MQLVWKCSPVCVYIGQLPWRIPRLARSHGHYSKYSKLTNFWISALLVPKLVNFCECFTNAPRVASSHGHYSKYSKLTNLWISALLVRKLVNFCECFTNAPLLSARRKPDQSIKSSRSISMVIDGKFFEKGFISESKFLNESTPSGQKILPKVPL